ncbi:hypothetical protein GC194_06310 [bacterium]|nr:hypothetical protein [bacterium]
MKFKLLICLLLFAGAGRAQYSIEAQIGNLAQSVPAYYFGYSEVLYNNLGGCMAMSNQMQHLRKRWRIRYALTMASQTINVSQATNGSINRSQLYNQEGIQYMGSLSNVLGSRDESVLRQYLLDQNGNRMVNPKTGEYISIDLNMPGGFGYPVGATPFVMPSLEIRLWKGLIVQGGWVPVGYFLRNFKEGNFTPKANLYSIGGGLSMRYFSKAPVLSWLRFDASYSVVDINLSSIQDKLDLNTNDYFTLNFTELNLSTGISSSQYRGSISIPVSKGVALVGQVGFYQFNYHFDFSYKMQAQADAEKLKANYNIDLAENNINIDDKFSKSYQSKNTQYYSGGVLLDGKVASFYLGMAYLNYPTFSFKTSLRII